MADTSDQDADYINQGLALLQEQIGRALEPDEAQKLGELAEQSRTADGSPDIQLMSDAYAAKTALDEHNIPDEDRQAFVNRAFDTPDENGLPDFQAAYDEYSDPGEPEPQPDLPDDASATERRAWLNERAGALDREAREDRDHRAAMRADTIAAWQDPGSPDNDLTAWQADGRQPDLDDKQERIAAMTERLQDLDAQDAA